MNKVLSLATRPACWLYAILRRKNAPGGNGGDAVLNQGPPDLDEVLGKIQQQIKKIIGGPDGGSGGSGGNGANGGDGAGSGGGSGSGGLYGILSLGAIILGVYLLFNSIHIVDEQEKGVVLRFGKHVATIEPGLNLRFPPPIEKVYRVNVKQVRRHEYKNAIMLTNDENMVDFSAALQYRIADPEAFIFNVRNPENTLIKSVESAVREVVGKNSFDLAISEGRRKIAERQEELLQEILDSYNTGILVSAFEIQESRAPDEVRAAFEDANAASVDFQRLIEEAEAYSNDILPRARGNAARMEEQARGYQIRIVESARGEADRFIAQYDEYSKAPEITRRRLYLDTMQEVLQVSNKAMITDTGATPLLYLPLDKMMESSPRGKMQNQDGSPATSSQRGNSGSAATQQQSNGRNRRASR